jgi:SAM-dependent methyltransferase
MPELHPALKKCLAFLRGVGRKYRDSTRACHFGLPGRKRVRCNICGWQGAKFLDYYGDFGHVYPNAECRKCKSHPRHRYFHLYLKSILPKDKPLRVVHFAPEQVLTNLLGEYGNIDYLSVDIEPGSAMRREDITRLSFPDQSFDIIICIHVLDHVLDDKQAMRELSRVLADEGAAIIDAPIDYRRQYTYEDPSVVTPEERTKAYWQKDHLRLCGRDFGSQLEEAGFKVKVDNYIEALGDHAAQRHGLEKNPIYLCLR